MRRAGAILLVLAALAGTFFLGRWSRAPSAARDAAPAREAAVGDAHSDPGRNAESTATPSIRSSPGAAPARATMPAAMRAPLPDVPVSARAPGPQPLRPEDTPRLDKAERVMGAEGGTTRDLLDLARDEPQDEQARQLEVLIAQSILRNGGHYTQLRLSAPHCTRSVCIIRGVGTGHTQDPRSDWQRCPWRWRGSPGSARRSTTCAAW